MSVWHLDGAPTCPALATAVVPTLDEGSTTKLSTDLSGNLRAAPSVGTLANPIRNQQVGSANSIPTSSTGVEASILDYTNSNPLAVRLTDTAGDYVSSFGMTLSAGVSGGATPFKSIDLDETEEEVKGSAGQVYGWYFFNAAAATRYIKFYNAAAADVTVGTTVPVMTIPVPSGSGANVGFTPGIAFDTAITVAATTGVADNDTGAPGANEVIVNIFYK